MSKISSHREHLQYGKMAAVSVMRMRTGSYAHIIPLINSVSRNLKDSVCDIPWFTGYRYTHVAAIAGIPLTTPPPPHRLSL